MRYAPSVRCAIALAALVSALFAARSAHATPTSKLVYSRSGDADACPDEQALRRAVAARVGYDPFFAWAPRTIVARLTRHAQAFVATVDLIDDSGVSHGARELRSEGECGELFDAVALAIAIAIDPQSLSQRSTPPAAASASAPADTQRQDTANWLPTTPEAEPERSAPARAPDLPADPVAFEVSAGSVASTGVAPGPAIGVALGAALRRRAFSLALEGRVDAPASTSASGGGDVSSWLVLGAVVPCMHLGPLFGCGIVQAGSAKTSGNGVPGTRSESIPWWATGGRLGVRFPLSENALLRLRTDVVGNLSRMTLRLDGADVWTAPPVAASLAADVVLHFP
jgi:hypothetical protein